MLVPWGQGALATVAPSYVVRSGCRRPSYWIVSAVLVEVS